MSCHLLHRLSDRRKYRVAIPGLLYQVQFKIWMNLLFCFLLLPAIPAHSTAPFHTVRVGGAITDMIIDGTRVFLSTDAGTIVRYDLKSGEKNVIFRLPPTTDFMGDPLPVKIFSLDKYSRKILAVTLGNHGFRNLLILEKGQQEELILAERDKMMIKKARWIDDHTLLLGLLCNDMVLFDTEKKRVINRFNVSPYTFSDFCLSENRKYVYTADESGIVHELELNPLSVSNNYTGINLDNIYRIVYKNGVILTGGQDRRVGVYNTTTGKNYFIQKDFLVYCVGLNRNGTTGAYTANEKNDISIFSTGSGEDIRILRGHKSMITDMIFYDDHTLISGGDDRLLIIWKWD